MNKKLASDVVQYITPPALETLSAFLEEEITNTRLRLESCSEGDLKTLQGKIIAYKSLLKIREYALDTLNKDK